MLTDEELSEILPEGWEKKVGKRLVSVRLDEEVIAWLRGGNKEGWTTRMNEVLRRVMEAERRVRGERGCG